MYMFRTSMVHHQEDSLYTQFCMVYVSCIYVRSLAGGRVCSNTQKLNYSINLKSLHFVGLLYVTVSQCTLQKTQKVKN
jgi:hypothetical protein